MLHGLRRAVAAQVLCALCALGLCACGGGGTALPSVPWPGHPADGIGMDYASASAAVAKLNEYRALAGVMPAELDFNLSRGCQLHANYLSGNRIDLVVVGLGAHDEDQSRPGFTYSGALAAQNSVIFQGVGPVEAIDKWFQTLYHRIGLLDPNLQRIGFGTYKGYQVMDIHQGRLKGSGITTRTVLYPAPEMINVPGGFKNEIPAPVPGDDSLGLPVTVEFFGHYGSSIVNVEAQLLNMDSGQGVPCLVQYPGSPILPGWDYEQLIALLPRDPLGRGEYMVSVSALVDYAAWSQEWSFKVR
jgi:hypothetical protein